jgi:hypothetical protein
MHKGVKLLLIGSSLLFAAPVFAQGDTTGAGDGSAAAPAPTGTDPTAGGATTPAVGATGTGVAATTAPAPKLWIGGGLELEPIGSISVSAGGQSASIGTDTGQFGIDVMALYAVHPMVSVGIAPRYLLNIHAGDGGDSAKMYDIRAVAAVHKEVAPKITALGMLGLGYASISPPMDAPSASGLTVSAHAGAGYAIGPKLMATALLGYELGFQSVSQNGQSADEHFNFFSFGVGIMAAVM